MKFAIVFAALFAVALAAPADVEILKNESDVGPESFQYAYETSDGAKAEAQGQVRNIGSEQEALAVQGSFSYISEDGQTYKVQYTADENGFQAYGDHLPVAPEA
ncbi:larval cuticle protein 65Ag1-like [Stomoxys calcitrans]|uniref:larval cuticle protein 65Ag1-like n=1 Tax=Stomoxys calcitrans TaxID=35570 RepID=UPI0027E38DC4|nr:larval cuticle protein 65Ag1-like [Stomoxys calcitrans]